MSDVADAFADGIRLKWAPGLNTIEEPTHASVEAWLAKGNYAWLSAPAGSGLLDLGATTIDFTNALASEISRFSCAAYESLLDSIPIPIANRALGWPLVRHYYATFYCAHALLRISGSAVAHISSATANRLNSVGGQYLGFSPQIGAGLHVVSVDPKNRSMVRLERLSAGAGGSHEDMWKQFLVFLTDVENGIILSQGHLPAALQAVQVSIKLRASLCAQGKSNGAWASGVRNAINYRHDFGVWYPYGKREQACIRLSGRMARWRPNSPDGLEIAGSADELARLADVCNVVTHFLTASLSDIARRAARVRKSFVDRYPFKLLRYRQVLT